MTEGVRPYEIGSLVYALVLLIGMSLILGLLTREDGLLGLGMMLNLRFGFCPAPGEWPWTRGFLVSIRCGYMMDPPGRSLYIDAVLRTRRRLHVLSG